MNQTGADEQSSEASADNEPIDPMKIEIKIEPRHSSMNKSSKRQSPEERKASPRLSSRQQQPDEDHKEEFPVSSLYQVPEKQMRHVKKYKVDDSGFENIITIENRHNF